MSHPYWYESSLLKTAGVVHGFTAREGGVSRGAFASWNFSSSVGDNPEHVCTNLSLLAERLNCATSTIHGVHQVHGNRIVEVLESEQVTTDERADGLLVRASRTTAIVKTADCVPVLVAAPEAGLVAALHAGWRGVQAEIVPAAIRRIRALAPETEVLVAIGPHIGKDAFQVGGEVAEVFADFARPDAREEGKYLVDLTAALQEQLRAIGVKEENVDVVEGCTLTDEEERFFSYRRSDGRCGRQIGFIQSP